MGNLSKQQYIALLSRAEDQLARSGVADPETLIHMLASIFYGADWSLDYKVEKSTVRNTLFGAYVARQYSAADDPRPRMDHDVFATLQANQDVEGVDFGHMREVLMARNDSMAATVSNESRMIVDLLSGNIVDTFLPGSEATLAIYARGNVPIQQIGVSPDCGTFFLGCPNATQDPVACPTVDLALPSCGLCEDTNVPPAGHCHPQPTVDAACPPPATDAGCPPPATSDCGSADCGTADCGTADCGSADCGTADCGSADCGSADCCSADCGTANCTFDCGATEDCATADCASVDCGTADCLTADCGSPGETADCESPDTVDHVHCVLPPVEE
ncbi:hypothetical protein AAKU55_005348 [Oxalobacteraceae bacterium GrIS 1.11]